MKRIMEIMCVLVVLIGGFFLVKVVFAEPLDSYHSRWHLVRDTAAEDGATFAAALDLAGGEGDFANKPSGAFEIRPFITRGIAEGTSPGAAWIFAFCGDNTEDDTFSFTMVGWARGNGMAEVIVHGDGVLGSQDVVLYPDDSATATNVFWADTVNLDATDLWPSLNQYNSGNNEVGILAVDLTGIEWVQFFIYGADGTGTEASTVTVFGRRY